MKNTAQTTQKIITLAAVLLVALAALANTKVAGAASGNLQTCQQNSTCTVGEFLYNDSYAPITDASCSFNSKYPNGDVFVNSQPMTAAAQNDGWYSYDVVATGSAGLYRTTICCSTGTEYLCLDKSFEIATAAATLTTADVANSVWNANRASYTTSGSFGEILQSIAPTANEIAAATWSYSSRTLSTFGTLISDVWSNATRLLTGATLDSGSLATKSEVDDKVNAKTQELKDEIAKISTNSADLDALKKTAQRTNNLLEQLVNKPIIETTVQDVPDLQVKLNETEGVATQLFVGLQSANSKIGLMKLNWNNFENSDVLDNVQELTRKLGGENDSQTSGSVFGYINFLKESWNWNPVGAIALEVKSVRDVLVSIQNEIESSGRTTATYSKVSALAKLLNQLDSSIGDASNKSGQETLFGKLKETKLLADSLDKIDGSARSLFASWDKYQLADKQQKLNDLSGEVVAVNRIPSINKTLLSPNPSSDKELKNKGYYVMGIVSANKKLLAGKTGTPMVNTWLELGSIIFKSLVINPSTIISQKVTLNYYLPPELKEEDVISVDAGLTIKYDTEKNQYYVTGEFLLGPSETQTVSVRTQDIWVIKKEEIDSLRQQAEALSKPLEKTSYFAQGVTIKSDIDVSLDKIVSLTSFNETPEAKIRAYREAQIELAAVHTKMDKLKELVTQAGSAGTFFGFVGGTQTLAVWGMIIILAVGFVFLALYMKMLTKHEEKEDREEDIKLVSPKGKKAKKEKKSKSKDKKKNAQKKKTKIKKAFVILLFLGIGSGLASGVMLGRSLAPSPEQKTVLSQVQDAPVLGATTSAVLADIQPASPSAQVKVIVPLGSWINVRSEASAKSSIVGRVEKTTEFTELARQDGWVKIALEDKEGWVSEEFALTKVAQESINNQAITINDTPTGFLRVRQSPWGLEVAQVHPGDKFVPVEEKDNWFHIELQDGSTGWVYGQYITKNNS